MKVIKRDGTEVAFDWSKIKSAIGKANERTKEMTEEDLNAIVKLVVDRCDKKSADIGVEEIQDIVESVLLDSQFNATAKSYILYRDQRTRIRTSKTKMMTEILDLVNGDSDYWNNENSNKNAKVVTTQRDYIAGITSTEISKMLLLPSDIMRAHEEGIIHFHDMDYFAQKSLHNCLAKETRFITDNGVKSFADFSDGDCVTVLTKSGQWKKAVVHCYGQGDLYDYTFYDNKKANIKHVLATENHRWYLKDGTITTDLKVGDKLVKAPVIYHQDEDYDSFSDYEKLLWCKGFALGDGVVEFAGKGRHLNSTRVRLCGDKDNAWVDRFRILDAKVRKYVFANGDQEVVVHNYHKEIPELHNLQEIRAFINGLYCADGKMSKGTQKRRVYRLQSSNKEVIEFIRDYAPVVGLYITSENDLTGEQTNFTHEEGRPYTILFSFNPDFARNYTVLGKKFARHDETWCLEVEDEHNFVLASGIVTGNCDLINLNDMLQNGTKINDIKIDRPHWLSKAMTIATQIITAVASSQYGGCTVTLTHIAPFVRDSYNKYLTKYRNRGCSEDDTIKYAKEDLAVEVESAVQTFNYQINSMSTTNGQAPFISVMMYMNETDEYKEELAMLIEEFLKQRIIGMKNDKGVYVTPAFPKLLYVLEEDNINPDGKYYYLTELAAKCSAKRLVPDYISEKMMKELKQGDCYPCMGCRSFLTVDRFSDKVGNVAKALDYTPGKHKYYGRFNQGVVTINLPDVAFSSEGNMDEFWKIFDERLELCHRALRLRHDRLLGRYSDMASILWQDGALARLDKHEKIDALLYGGYSTISLGYGGLYECVKYMTGHSHTDGAEGEAFGLKVMQYLNDACAKWKSAENIDYSIYGTPMESTTYKFAKCLKKRFGNDIFVKLDGKDRSYITNSYHVPVFEDIDAFHKLALESEFQKLSPGGAISYVETSDLTGNVDAVMTVIKFIYDHIMYAELNTKSDYCQCCGYDGEMKIDENMNWYCPNCGNRDQTKMNVARRTCGYIGSKYWNYGRTQEIKDRVIHLGGDGEIERN